jgi:hypothetical protein
LRGGDGATGQRNGQPAALALDLVVGTVVQVAPAQRASGKAVLLLHVALFPKSMQLEWN